MQEVIEGVAGNGGYIMDASAIMQNDARDREHPGDDRGRREFGVYSAGHSRKATPPPQARARADGPKPAFLQRPGADRCGVCVPWAEKRPQIPAIPGDEAIVQRIWEDIEGLANMFIWQVLVSF